MEPSFGTLLKIISYSLPFSVFYSGFRGILKHETFMTTGYNINSVHKPMLWNLGGVAGCIISSLVFAIFV